MICCVLGSIFRVVKLSFSVSLFINLLKAAVSSLFVLEKNFKDIEFHNLQMNNLVFVPDCFIQPLFSDPDKKG